MKPADAPAAWQNGFLAELGPNTILETSPKISQLVQFKDLMDDLETKAPGLFLAGHYRDGISVGDSIVSGGNAAELVENFLKI